MLGWVLKVQCRPCSLAGEPSRTCLPFRNTTSTNITQHHRQITHTETHMRRSPARDVPMRFMRRKRVWKRGTRTTSLIFLVALPSVLEGVALLALRLRLASMAGALQSGWIVRIYGQRLQFGARALYATEE